MSMLKYFFTITFFTLLINPYIFSQNDSFATSSLEIPLCQATISKKNGNDHEVHSYAGFEICYRESYEIPEWSAYTLTKEKLIAISGRTNNFRPDKQISSESAHPDDYKKTGYDRGHLTPAADMEWSLESVSDSFLMSNMTPQKPELNRGMWKNLESKIRTWMEDYEEIVIVSGPVLDKKAEEFEFIGINNRVSVPEYFYKVLLFKHSDGNISSRGYLMPNKKCEGTLEDYRVTVNKIENLTGLDFFSQLDDSMEEEIEKM